MSPLLQVRAAGDPEEDEGGEAALPEDGEGEGGGGGVVDFGGEQDEGGGRRGGEVPSAVQEVKGQDKADRCAAFQESGSLLLNEYSGKPLYLDQPK